MEVPVLYFAAESEQGIAALGLDPIAMLLQAGTFLVIYFIVKKYLLEGITKTLEDRRMTIEESLANAEQIENEKVQLEQTKEEILKAARQEADKIIASGNQEAGRIIADAESEAEKRAEKIVTRANQQLEASVKKAKAELKGEISSLAAKATETILLEKLNSDKDEQLIERAIQEAEL